MIFFDSTYGDALALAIAGANEKVDVAMYVWRRTDENPTLNLSKIITELLRASARGVQVRIMTDFPTSAAMLRHEGLDAVAVETGRTMHAKMVVIDHKCVFIGSHNMTKRSLNSNYEVTARLDGFEYAAQAHQYFDMMWDYYAGS